MRFSEPPLWNDAELWTPKDAFYRSTFEVGEVYAACIRGANIDRRRAYIREHPQQPTDVYPNHISWVREESHGAPHEWAAA